MHYKIGDCNIDYRFLYPETAAYFSGFAVPGKEMASETMLSLETTQDMLEQYYEYLQLTRRNDSYAEFEVLSMVTSTAMLSRKAFLFHSVGFSYEGKALLFTGPSGIGKTTQYAQWKRNFGEKVSIISGDEPVLALRGDQRFWVMPSPWNGKENLHGDTGAPLGGIIVLEQGVENRIAKMDTSEMVLALYRQMCLYRQTRCQVEQSLALLDQLLRAIPVWKLSSRGDLASAKLCHDEIAGEIYG